MVAERERQMVCPCGHQFDVVSKAMYKWDICDVCGQKAIHNEHYTPESFPGVVIPGGATFAPALHPDAIKKQKANELKRRKVDIIKSGKGSIVDRDQAVQKLIFESRQDEIRDGRLDIKVPRLIDEGFKPEIELKYQHTIHASFGKRKTNNRKAS